MGYSDALENQWATASWLQSSAAKDAIDTPTEGLNIGNGKQHRHNLISSCIQGQAYYVGAEIVDLLTTVSKDMPDWTLLPEHLPSQRGYCWLEKPLAFMIVDEEDPDGWLWEFPAFMWYSYMEDGCTKVCVALCLRYPRIWAGVPLVTIQWSSGWSCREMLNYLYSLKDGPQPEGYFDCMETVTRFFAALLQFMNQQILLPEPQQAVRATRKRLEGNLRLSKREPLINIVMFRRSRHDQPEDAGAGREYTCQWMVRGHWRQQWYPSLGRHQPKWIMPYVKGPEDKPIKLPKPTVFAVVR